MSEDNACVILETGIRLAITFCGPASTLAAILFFITTKQEFKDGDNRNAVYSLCPFRDVLEKACRGGGELSSYLNP